MSRRRHTKKRGLRIILTCLFAIVFLFSAFMAISAMVGLRRADEATALLRLAVATTAPETTAEPPAVTDAPEATAVPEVTPEPDGEATIHPSASPTPAPTAPVQRVQRDFGPLKAVSEDIVGWISGEGTPIDYPILRADDNSYYLNHLYTGETNKSGSIFLDYRNGADLQDRNLVIYGHHMSDGSMFASLDKYKSQEYYDQGHEYTLYTPQGDYRIELIAGTEEDGNYEFVRFDFDSDQDFMDYVETFRQRSTFKSDVTIAPGDRIISLCTCTYDRANARYMVIGRLMPIY